MGVLGLSRKLERWCELYKKKSGGYLGSGDMIYERNY